MRTDSTSSTSALRIAEIEEVSFQEEELEALSEALETGH